MNKLAEVIKGISGSSFVGLTTVTDVKLLGGKKNPQQGNIKKHTTSGSIILFSNQSSNGYENMVKRRLEKEGKSSEDFKLGERAWGKRIENSPFVEHKGKYYLECIFLSSPQVEYRENGLPINKKDIQGLQEKTEGNQGNLENKVVIRTYSVESIRELRIDGKEYKF